MMLLHRSKVSPTTLMNIRFFSSASVALAGRQGDRFRKVVKYSVDNMETFAFDDQTTIGHDLFENIRNVRQYLRKTQYELPKLSGKDGNDVVVSTTTITYWRPLSLLLSVCETLRPSYCQRNRPIQNTYLLWRRPSCRTKGRALCEVGGSEIDQWTTTQALVVGRAKIPRGYRRTHHVKWKIPQRQPKQEIRGRLITVFVDGSQGNKRSWASVDR